MQLFAYLTLSLASGATALGSVKPVTLARSPALSAQYCEMTPASGAGDRTFVFLSGLDQKGWKSVGIIHETQQLGSFPVNRCP